MVLVGVSSDLDPNRLRLTTKKGTPIPNSQRPEYEDYQIPYAIETGNKQGKNAKFRSISDTYNCVGMVFGARRTWIDEELVELILNDDGYHRVMEEHDIFIGDVIVYRHLDGKIRHVGIVVTIYENLVKAQYSFLILSKWGRLGEYIHAPDDVPEIFLDMNIEYWSERRIR